MEGDGKEREWDMFREAEKTEREDKEGKADGDSHLFCWQSRCTADLFQRTFDNKPMDINSPLAATFRDRTKRRSVRQTTERKL